MKITFYYWGTQCPVIDETIQLLKKYENIIQIETIDFSESSDIAIAQEIYFPFLTVFGAEQRWFSPLNARVIEAYINGEKIQEQPYVIEQGTELFTGELMALNDQNFDRIREGCTVSNCAESCQKKRVFLSEMGESFYGILNVDQSKVVGGVEFVPSLKVPYAIPKGEKIAFITCVYHSSTRYDYKSKPLKALEDKLKDQYDEIVAITDEFGTFPNGNLEWFLKNGFVDCGVIRTEANYCKLHLVTKKIKFAIRYVEKKDQEFWYSLDKHLPKREFEKKVRDQMGYMILKDGVPVGIMRYNLFWDNTPFLTLIFIEETYQKEGLGHHAMSYWEREMKSLGYDFVMTSTQVDENAQHFYRKLGYKDCGCLMLDIPGHEQPMEMFMMKAL